MMHNLYSIIAGNSREEVYRYIEVIEAGVAETKKCLSNSANLYFPLQFSRLSKLCNKITEHLTAYKIPRDVQRQNNFHEYPTDAVMLKIQQIFFLISGIMEKKTSKDKSLDVIKKLIEQLSTINMDTVIYS